MAMKMPACSTVLRKFTTLIGPFKLNAYYRGTIHTLNGRDVVVRQIQHSQIAQQTDARHLRDLVICRRQLHGITTTD